MQKYVIWILKVHVKTKKKKFRTILQMVLKKDLVNQTMELMDRYQNGYTKK